MDYTVFLTGLFLLIAGLGCCGLILTEIQASRWPLLATALSFRETWHRIHRADRTRLFTLIRSRHSSEAEIRLKDASGNWLWFMLRGRVIFSETNRAPMRLVGTILNIDDAHRARLETDKQRSFAHDVMESVPNGLAVITALGTAASVDRCYLFQVHPHPELGSPAMSQAAEWNSGSAVAQIQNPQLQNLPFAESGHGRWLEKLLIGQEISGFPANFPPEEGAILIAQDIRSIVIVPIFSSERLWGFLGFDACHEDRVWQSWEISILRSAANIGLRQVVQDESNALVLAHQAALPHPQPPTHPAPLHHRAHRECLPRRPRRHRSRRHGRLSRQAYQPQPPA